MLTSLIAVLSLSLTCATLSVFVVSRRWAFIGEGIGHSGFGGAGTAWVVGLIFPSLDQPWVVSVGVVVFCLLTAVAIGYFTDGAGIAGDTAIGIFMVASLAWGFLARQAYQSFRHSDPVGFDDLLFGQASFSQTFAVSVALTGAAVLLLVATFAKEFLYYCYDPEMARVSGVRARGVHYLLLLLVTLTIVLGIRVAGSVLVTALLILPAAASMSVFTQLRAVVFGSTAAAALAAAAGVLTHAHWPFVPVGPAVVLVLFAEFLLSVAVRQLSRPALVD